MRITFVKEGLFGMAGGDRVIEIHARLLQQRGHDVEVVSSPTAGPTWKQQAKSVLRHGRLARQVRGPSHFATSPVRSRYIDRSRPIVARDLPDADVVVATWWETAPWVAALPPEKGAKAYFIQHYEVFDHIPAAAVDATWRLDLHKITIASWLVDLAREFGDDDVTLVPNSVDTGQFHAPPRDRSETPTIGLLYHGAPWKGVATSLAAIRTLARQLPRLRLLSFGEEPFAPDLPGNVEHRHWQAPPQSSIRDIYAQCDAWVAASVSEGFGLTPLEAMACRTPVVSTAVGGPRDFVIPGVNGYLAAIGDDAAIAGHLRTIATLAPRDWRAMSDQAHRTATGYTWEDASRRFEAGLERAIAKAARAR